MATTKTYLPGDRRRPREGAEAEDAYKLLSQGFTRVQIARLWGVSRARVTQILQQDARAKAKQSAK